MPGIWPSQSAGWFQGIEEATGLSEAQPARSDAKGDKEQRQATRSKGVFIV